MIFDHIFKKSKDSIFLKKDINVTKNICAIMYNDLDEQHRMIDVPKSKVIIKQKMNPDGSADCTITIKLHKSSFFNGSRSTVYKNVVIASINGDILIYDAKLFSILGAEATQLCAVICTKLCQGLYINNIDDFLK